MARARNIKPGMYKNEDLAECSIWARYIFPGLWMLADREGRLEDRPKRIKGELLPFDLQDVEPLLQELAERKDGNGIPFIIRYRNSEGSFIQISKFSAHQTPHYSEKGSAIKPPEFPELTIDDGDDRTGKHRTLSAAVSEKPPPIKRGSQPPDSLIHRFSDSPNPESLQTPEAGASVAAADPSASDLLGDAPTGKLNGHHRQIPACPHSKIVAAYHEILPTLDGVRTWKGHREEHSRCRWRETFERLPELKTEADGVQWFRELFQSVKERPWLMGKVPPRDGGPPFRADLEWLLRPKNFAKLLDGKWLPQ